MMQRRHFFTAAIAAATAAAAGAQTTAPDKPNIIFFLVDDMGWQETSVPFYEYPTPLNERYRTPNMERLAQRGVKFTNAYACAISSPSRCSLMTGMNAARHRVTNWTLHRDEQTDQGGGGLDLPSWSWNGIQPDGHTAPGDTANATLCTPLPELLRRGGYYTVHCGKAHFGAEGTPGENPLKMGFDVNIAGGANGAPGSYLAEKEYGSGSFHVSGLEKYYGTGIFLTEALTIEALAAIEKPIAKGKPFYLYMSHYAIHSPYDADTRFTPGYANRYDPQLNAFLNQSEINHAALVEGMDKSLGDILDFLDERPEVAANTVILFMSDNGGQGVGPRQGRQNFDQNFPARGGKGSAYEGGIHEPMIVSWPGVTRGGDVNPNRVMIEDFFPTIVELAGVSDRSTRQTVDGRSFVDLLRHPEIRRDRPTVWHFPNRWGESTDRSEGYGAYSAFMKGPYHLIYFWETGERRLYNIREDIAERNDIASAEPWTLESMSRELSDSLRAMGAQRPSFKATGQLCPWPDEAVITDVAEPGQAVEAATAVELSTAAEPRLYTITDSRPGTPFQWARGRHNGHQAIQCATVGEPSVAAADRLFFFAATDSPKRVTLHTALGENVAYRPGTTADSWAGGILAPLGTYKFLQYGTEIEPSEMEIVATGTPGVYAVRVDGDLMNDRGTGNGAAASMKWVVNTYSGNSVADAGSRYVFTAVDPAGIGMTDAANAPGSGPEWYNLAGVRLAGEPAVPGIYIVRKNGCEPSKILVR